jgi:hypothetical protein
MKGLWLLVSPEHPPSRNRRASGDEAALVAQRAGLDAFRIVEAVSSEKEEK